MIREIRGLTVSFFRQGEKSYNTKHGIGLFIVKAILRFKAYPTRSQLTIPSDPNVLSIYREHDKGDTKAGDWSQTAIKL